jgi:SAM-dependent methyltransferase
MKKCENTCRFCQCPLTKTFINLGEMPLSNSYLSDLNQKEIFYPLRVQICEKCFLVQIPEMESPQSIFSNYAYFSSYSDSWLKHSENYVQMITQRFEINCESQVIEIASNDGYLLQYFKKMSIPVLGIEPAVNVAAVAREKGIETLSVFFGVEEAKKLIEKNITADLLIGNNVLAHVPDLNDFVAGLKIILATDGVLTMEFPHLLSLIQKNQFDTIYHEHFSYFSFLTAQRIFAKHRLTIFDVEELSVHGGSLRIYINHSEYTQTISSRVDHMIQKEKKFQLDKIETYQQSSSKIIKIKNDLLEFISQVKQSGKKIAAYGAPAKGNTLLNFCGIHSELLPFTVDKNPHKQNCFLPGSHIPIFHPDKIKEAQPDYLLLLPWNLKDEIMEQMSFIKNWQGKFVVPIPSLEII